MSAVVSVGVFDGLHLGHLTILERALAGARERGVRCVVVSFDPHPDVVLSKSFRPMPPLTPLPEKRKRIETLGVDSFELLPFTRELAGLSPEEFVERHLVRPFGLEELVVGENFALGRDRAGDVRRLGEIGRTHGFTVEPVPLVERDGDVVSSTRIRALLAEGRVADAARLLGRRYGLAGIVVAGHAVGRTLGVPTANLRLSDEKLLPRLGVYAAWARIAGEREWRAAAMSVGVRPTFDGQDVTLEVHLLDWNGDLYGRELEIELEEWLRPEERFASTDELVQAMRRDLDDARRVLAARSPKSASVAGPAGRA